MKCEKLGSHTISDQSLLLSTIILNDSVITIRINIAEAYSYSQLAKCPVQHVHNNIVIVPLNSKDRREHNKIVNEEGSLGSMNLTLVGPRDLLISRDRAAERRTQESPHARYSLPKHIFPYRVYS